MVNDVLPEILQSVKAEFEKLYGKSDIVSRAFEELKAKKATYRTANEFAIEIGEILSKALISSVIPDKLPDGKMYYNIGKRLLNDTLKRNYDIVAEYSVGVQKILNEKAKIGLKVQVPEMSQDRIDGMVNRLSYEAAFDSVQWMFGEPIVNFSQSIVDDTIKANAEFHSKAGLSAQIVRKESGKCCDWCREVVGTYTYPRVPRDVYRRHQRCRCTVDYYPGNGKKQNVHSKRLTDDTRSQRIEQSRRYALDEKLKKLYNKAMRINTPEAYSQALLESVSVVEPQITRDMQRIAGHDRLAGLEFRKKTANSLARKIESDSLLDGISLSQATNQINDALRYTTILQPETFASDYHKMKERLLSEGYQVVKVKNTWLGNNPYKGVNTVLEKDGFSFEMQYHTQESFDLKNGKLHQLYEERRLTTTSLKRKLEIDKTMLRLSQTLKIPNDIKGVN